MPLSLAVTIYGSSPITTTILSYFILGEKLTKFELISIFSAMFGVVLLTEPSWIFPSLKFTNQAIDDLEDEEKA